MQTGPTISADIHFLSEAEGDRRSMPDLALGSYAPHLVVPTEGHGAPEEYLGVRFVARPTNTKLGETVRCSLGLLYYPLVRYTALQVGAEFEVREGPKVVGHGTVVSDDLTERIVD